MVWLMNPSVCGGRGLSACAAEIMSFESVEAGAWGTMILRKQVGQSIFPPLALESAVICWPQTGHANLNSLIAVGPKPFHTELAPTILFSPENIRNNHNGRVAAGVLACRRGPASRCPVPASLATNRYSFGNADAFAARAGCPALRQPRGPPLPGNGLTRDFQAQYPHIRHVFKA